MNVAPPWTDELMLIFPPGENDPWDWEVERGDGTTEYWRWCGDAWELDVLTNRGAITVCDWNSKTARRKADAGLEAADITNVT